MLFKTFTSLPEPPVQLLWLLCEYIYVSLFHYFPVQSEPVPNAGTQEMFELAPTPYRDQLENPVLGPGAQSLRLVLPS